MRQLAIAVLGVWLAMAAAAHAGGEFGDQKKSAAKGGFASPFDSPAMRPPPGFGAAPSQSYKPHSASGSLKPIDNTGSTSSTQSIGGAAPFKPFKGTSTYDGPGAFKPYKPAKPKSVYDH
jgi:hypothetical protein